MSQEENILRTRANAKKCLTCFKQPHKIWIIKISGLKKDTQGKGKENKCLYSAHAFIRFMSLPCTFKNLVTRQRG